MKTKELKSLLEKIDYSVKRINGMIVIENEYGNAIATIEENTTFKFSTQYYAWNGISYSEQKLILSYIMGYAATPIDEREEEKKFYLRHKYFKNWDNVQYFTFDYIHMCAYLRSKLSTCKAMQQFTEKEIEEIKEKYNTDLKDFEMIEVEE